MAIGLISVYLLGALYRKKFYNLFIHLLEVDRKGKYRIIKNEFNKQSREEVLEEIYNQHFERLLAYAYVITNSEEFAKDVVSEVFFNLWKGNRDFTEIRDLRAYLFTAVKNQARRVVSLETNRFQSLDSVQSTKITDFVNPEDLLVGKELEKFIEEVVTSLSPQAQLVFRLVREENLKYKEVSEKLGVSINTVKNHLTAALRKIRHNLNQYCPEDPSANSDLPMVFLLLMAEVLF